jgi:hypothetical protein
LASILDNQEDLATRAFVPYEKHLVVHKVASGLYRVLITTRLKKIKGRNLSLSYMKEKF